MLDFYLFEMYDQGCRAPFVILRQHKFVMTNTFDFISFLSSFWSLMVTSSVLFFVWFFFLFVGFFLFVVVCFVLSGNNYTEILCHINTVRNYFPHVLFLTFTP